MNDVPDGLWQGIATNLLADAMIAALVLTWKHRRALQRKPVLLSGTMQGKSHLGGTLTVEKTLDARWKVEAPKPSLARRLEDLAVWYLHVS